METFPIPPWPRQAAKKSHQTKSEIQRVLQERPPVEPAAPAPAGAHAALTDLERQRGYLHPSSWDRRFTSLFHALPDAVQEQAIEKHEQWRRGSAKSDFRKIKEWKGDDVWELRLGDYRAFARRLSDGRYHWYWIGHAQKAKKLLSSQMQLNWYKKGMLAQVSGLFP
jgi:hypothetical protein